MEVTWRVIAREGFDRATMRQICAAAGYANGALKPYFPTKEALLEATFEYVFDRTTDRIEKAVGESVGLQAIEAFADQVLPTSHLMYDEARVVIPFWQRALHNQAEQAVNREKMVLWHDMLTGWFIDEQLPADDAENAAHTLLTFLLGSQVTAALEMVGADKEGLREQFSLLVQALISAKKSPPEK